jgi:hypothetical protein
LAELGLITVFFDVLSFNLQGLLVTLEKPEDLTMEIGPYARLPLKEIIRKCGKALNNLEPSFSGKRKELFKDCREQLAQCDKLRERRNELIHALWSPSAFPPHAATRLQTIKTESGSFQIIPQGHDLQSLRDVSLEIRNAYLSLHVLTVKFRLVLQMRAKS